MNLLARLFFLLALLGAQSGVLAQSVGRTKVADLSGGWTELVAYDSKGLSLNGGEKHIPMQGMAFLNASRNMLLIVESTATGNNGRSVSWVSMKCPQPKADYFTNDYGANQTPRDTRCLVVNTKYSSKSYLAEVSPQTAEAVEKQGLRFEKGQLIRTWSGIKGGSFLKVYFFKTSAFQTESGTAKGGEAGVDPALIAFGESLQQLVYDSTLSLSGNLSLQLLNTIK